MAEPTDEALYNKSKQEVDKNYDKPSAYRSMAYARTYLKNYREKYGDDKKAYKGKNPEELKTWRKEKWLDVKSVLKDPKNPTACGNAPIKAGEYPLCMPVKEIAKYGKTELQLLVNRKNELGKKRLVKDAFLRDVLEPEKIPAIREYKDKYAKTKAEKLPKPLPKEQAAKILKEKPVKVSEPTVVEKPVVDLEARKEAKRERERARYQAKERIAKPRPKKTEEEKQATLEARIKRKNERAKARYAELNPPKEITRSMLRQQAREAKAALPKEPRKPITFKPTQPAPLPEPSYEFYTGDLEFN
jgi:hypothetical protein